MALRNPSFHQRLLAVCKGRRNEFRSFARASSVCVFVRVYSERMFHKKRSVDLCKKAIWHVFFALLASSSLKLCALLFCVAVVDVIIGGARRSLHVYVLVNTGASLCLVRVSSACFHFPDSACNQQGVFGERNRVQKQQLRCRSYEEKREGGGAGKMRTYAHASVKWIFLSACYMDDLRVCDYVDGIRLRTPTFFSRVF